MQLILRLHNGDGCCRHDVGRRCRQRVGPPVATHTPPGLQPTKASARWASPAHGQGRHIEGAMMILCLESVTRCVELVWLRNAMGICKPPLQCCKSLISQSTNLYYLVMNASAGHKCPFSVIHIGCSEDHLPYMHFKLSRQAYQSAFSHVPPVLYVACYCLHLEA